MVIIVKYVVHILWLKGNPYHWFDLSETQDLACFSEIRNKDNIYI